MSTDRWPDKQTVNPLQYSCLGNAHGQRSLAGCSPWGRKESDPTERLSTAHSTAYVYILIYIWILFSHKKEWNLAIWDYIDRREGMEHILLPHRKVNSELETWMKETWSHKTCRRKHRFFYVKQKKLEKDKYHIIIYGL